MKDLEKVALAGGAAILGYVAYSSLSKKTGEDSIIPNLPGVPNIDISLPQINFPEIRYPNINYPAMPDYSKLVDSLKIPDIKIPDFTRIITNYSYNIKSKTVHELSGDLSASRILSGLKSSVPTTSTIENVASAQAAKAKRLAEDTANKARAAVEELKAKFDNFRLPTGPTQWDIPIIGQLAGLGRFFVEDVFGGPKRVGKPIVDLNKMIGR